VRTRKPDPETADSARYYLLMAYRGAGEKDKAAEALDELTAKVGLDRGTAEKVVQFLKDNAHRLPELLGSDAAKGVMDKLPGGLGEMLGGKG